MAGFEIHKEPEYAYRYVGLGLAAQAFDANDPVSINANGRIIATPADETVPEDGEIIGIACCRAEGVTAGSRAAAAADGFGAVTGDPLAYWPVNAPGLLLRTRNYWNDETANPPTETAITGALKGAVRSIVAADHTLPVAINDDWGVNTNAPAGAAGAYTDVAVQVIEVLDANMNPVDDTAVGEWLVFRILPDHSQLDGF